MTTKGMARRRFLTTTLLGSLATLATPGRSGASMRSALPPLPPLDRSTRDTVRAFYAAVADGDPEALRDIFTSDGIWKDARSGETIGVAAPHPRRLRRLVVEDDVAVAEWVAHRTDGPSAALVRGTSWITVEGGRVSGVVDYVME